MIAAIVLSTLIGATGNRPPVHLREMASWPQADVRTLAAGVEKALSAPQLRGAHAGIAIVDPASGEVAYQRDLDGAFIPASSLKVLLGAAGLEILGPQYRAQTDVFAHGGIAPGLLIGDLYLRGGGDPLLLDKDLSAAADAVVHAGINRISGRVYYDSSRFNGRQYANGWPIEDLPRFFEAPISALSLDENVLPMYLAPSTLGERARITPLVAQTDVSVVNALLTVAAGANEQFDCARDLGTNVVRVVGSIRENNPGARLGCSVVDGAHYAATAFAALLQQRGVQFSGGVNVRAVPTDSTLLWRHDSIPYGDLLAKILQPSDNFAADVVLKQLAVQQGRPGGFAEGVSALNAFAADVGVDPLSMALVDGSGLSPDNRISPRALATILAFEAGSPMFNLFRNALPVAGASGTLANRFLASPARGNVFAKPGTLPHVSTLAGYARTRHHGLMVFVVMFNDYMRTDTRPLLNAEEQIAEALVTL